MTTTNPPIHGFVPWSHDRLSSIRDTRARAWVESLVVDKPKRSSPKTSTPSKRQPAIKLPATLSPELQAQIRQALGQS